MAVDSSPPVGPGSRTKGQTAAEQIGSILAAAEQAAEQIREQAETRLRDRIAEGQRAADNWVRAAEEEATETLASARAEAEELRRGAREAAERYSRERMSEARAVTDEVRAEGLELVSNLRQTADSLRSNAERLLRDVQSIHSQMMARVDRADALRRSPGVAAPRGPGRSGGDDPDDSIEIPEFIPPR